jgi:hypothetical protein
MRSLSSLAILFLFQGLLQANQAGYTVIGTEPGAWPQILSSIGLLPATDPGVFVARPGAAADPSWRTKVEGGAFLILEGDSALAASFGFRPSEKFASVASMIDVHQPKLPLIPKTPLLLREHSVPGDARVFTKDRWSPLAVVAGMKLGKGAVLWVAANPGDQGYERFPYLLHALTDLGFEPPFRSRRTWVFFDYSYRTRVDLDYFAIKWRKAGISALHVAAWHFYEPDPARDQYLIHLIEACHREGIAVYAWLELPHVSEKFWNDHPEWREKTAVQQDAALDWRKLMNLSDRDCFHAVSSGVSGLISRFDWDGVNLAELYFESLEGASNPARFTPLNSIVRADFKKQNGFDPMELWSTRTDAASLRLFLDYRAVIARRMQQEWLTEIETYRASKPDLDIVLTHVDDRMDTGIKDAIGADSASVLPLLDGRNFTFLIEDPATVWNLGPRRYPEIAKRYPPSPKLAIDINVVERYQDVYPTKQQTGTELFELVHLAATAFPRVALYFENSILEPDLGLLSAASSVVTRYEQKGAEVLVDSPHGFLLPWGGSATLDGEPWNATDGHSMIVPSGRHTIRGSPELGWPHLIDFNGDIQSARFSEGRIELRYFSSARALAKLDCEVKELFVDGAEATFRQIGPTLLLPSGKRHAIALCK